jgi:hypothetical protein
MIGCSIKASFICVAFRFPDMLMWCLDHVSFITLKTDGLLIARGAARENKLYAGISQAFVSILYDNMT